MGSTWSVNPLALVQLITGDDLRGKGWDEAQPALEAFFQVKEEMIFQGEGADPARLQLFQDLANAVTDPVLLADLRKMKLVQQLFQRYGRTSTGATAIELALPFLVPVSDAAISSHAQIHDYVLTDVSYLDPVQGNAKDCYLISAMIALAWSRPSQWAERVRSVVGAGNPPAFRYAFHGGAADDDAKFDVAPRLPADSRGRLAFARSSAQLDAQGARLEASLAGLAEAWPPMLEKAFAIWKRPRGADAAAPGDVLLTDYHYISDHRSSPESACVALAGGVPRRAFPIFDAPLTGAIRALCDEPQGRRVTRDPTMAWTFEDPQRMHGRTFAATGLVHNHAYAVLGMLSRASTEYVVLRNPWGLQPFRPDGYAEGTWNPGDGPCGAAEVELNRHGVFALRADWFDDCFAAVGWAEH